MKNNNIQQTTFWAFLINEHRKIEIPIIQRDYAQGRIGKEKLREKFLTDIKTALDKKDEKDNKPLKLDFVYGSVENNRLNPLDGQQRLTTLWLLYWYIAFKSGELQNNRGVFKKFTYETRTTSREFCNKLSDFESIETDNIVQTIKNQTWFFSSWKQDPTIQAMMNMLGGNSIKDDKENEIIDGFDEIFEGCVKGDFKKYWEKLTGDYCPIIFYYIDLLDLSLSDDLYIKMNARGKPLSNFENFKADLVGYIGETEKNIDQQNKVPVETIEHKLDTTWTNIFWKYRSQESEIDKAYFAFINRFWLNLLITAKAEEQRFLSDPEKNNKLFKYLYGDRGNDVNIRYNGFDLYESEKSVIKEGLEKLEKVLDRFHNVFNGASTDEINELFFPNWEDNSDFRFIPGYKKDEDREKYFPTTITQSQRVVFHAICCYFEKGDYEKKSLMRWIRIVWNIVENADIDSIQKMIGAMRLINELADNSHDILNHLRDRDVSKDFAKEQMEEEKEKARQILDNSHWKDSDGKSWEDKIIEAENTAFFKGAIRFLFRTGNNEYDWDKFDNRFEKCKMFFNKQGVEDEYKKDAILLRNLISHFNNWGQFWDIVYENKASAWKNILTKEKWLVPVGCLLDNNLMNLQKIKARPDETFIEENKTIHRELVCTNLLSLIVGGCQLKWMHGKHCLYPPRANANWKKYVVGDKRNSVLSKLVDNQVIVSEQKLEGVDFFWGWDIEFTSDKKPFRWNTRDFLEELNENKEWIKHDNVSLEKLKDFLLNHSKNSNKI